jgi:hypothetical protein
LRITPDDQRHVRDGGARQRIGDMRDHRPARDRMQHLRHCRFHPRAFASRQDDRQASPFHALLLLGIFLRGYFSTGILMRARRPIRRFPAAKILREG